MVNLDELYKIEKEIKKKISFWQMQLEIVQSYKMNKAEKEIVIPKYEYVNNTETETEAWYKQEDK